MEHESSPEKDTSLNLNYREQEQTTKKTMQTQEELIKADEESEYESYYCESGQEAEDHSQKNTKKVTHNLSAEQSQNDKSVEKSKESEQQRPAAVQRKQRR